MKPLPNKVKLAALTVVCLLVGYVAGKLESRAIYLNNFNGYMNITQLEEISLLHQLREGKIQEATSSLEASLAGGFFGRSISSGGMQAFRALNSKDSASIKDLDNVVLGINEYFCKYDPARIDTMLIQPLQNELESMGRKSELCKSGR